MSEPQPPSPDAPSALERALGPVHRASLLALALCALFIFSRAGGPESAPHRLYTTAAVVLAMTSVATRRLASSPRLSGSPRALLAILSLISAVSVGVIGAILAAEQGARQTGLLFTLGITITCLRPPVSLAASRDARSG